MRKHLFVWFVPLQKAAESLLVGIVICLAWFMMIATILLFIVWEALIAVPAFFSITGSYAPISSRSFLMKIQLLNRVRAWFSSFHRPKVSLVICPDCGRHAYYMIGDARQPDMFSKEDLLLQLSLLYAAKVLSSVQAQRISDQILNSSLAGTRQEGMVVETLFAEAVERGHSQTELEDAFLQLEDALMALDVSPSFYSSTMASVRARLNGRQSMNGHRLHGRL